MPDSRRRTAGRRAAAPAPPRTTLSLAELVSAAAVRAPQAVALACGPDSLTCVELDRAVAALAGELRERGVRPGDAVGVLAGTGLEFVVEAHAVLRAEGVVVPISPASPPPEAARMLRIAEVTMVLADAEREEHAWASAELYDRRCGALVVAAGARRGGPNLVPLRTLAAAATPPSPERVAAATPAVILFTSGSEAHPKAVVHSHESLMWNCQCVAREMLALGSADVMLGALPLAHSFGFSAVVNAALLAGARLELLPRFDADAAWDLIYQRGITVLTGVPTMYSRLANHPRSTRNTDLRAGVVSGAACPPAVAAAVRTRIGIDLIERYGMTEASPLTWRTMAEAGAAGDVGRPGWGVRVRAVGPGGGPLGPGREGEIEVRAPGMMLGYLDPADTARAMRDGWLRTGDLGAVGADGALTLRGRLKDVILRGGHTISAAEVEAVLAAHPGVAEVAVLGIPHPDLGEELAAAVVLAAGADVAEADLERAVVGQLASWKRPRRWRFLDALPRTALGKVRRDHLRRLFAE